MATTSTSSSRNQGGLISRLLRRGREERLPQAAGGLTFTMVMSMVPLLALSFALFARIPALHAAGDAIREHLLRGLLPDGIARTVLKHLAQFAGNTGGLTQVGFALLLVSALALLMSVETTLNRIWQVKKPRPLLRRLGLYLGMLLTGPVLIGASLWAASYLATASSGLPVARPGWLPHALNIGPMVLSAAGFACLFRFVPHTVVRWRDAIAGGMLAGIAFELGKQGFAIYLANVPTYRTIYGAFAPLLAFLLWVYYSWLVTLAAALFSASLPRGGSQPARRLSRAY
ncbi:YhjD/YihY/BrkB family envelope integrity protein [Polaromonas sp. CT11-55]|uniref:YhjD/YihY/BrkB family envelope integrity protein n=1 Tax=Polaromonas sp. CT11-55 TaxID=3243045 RepID=UPI0039A5ABA2